MMPFTCMLYQTLEAEGARGLGGRGGGGGGEVRTRAHTNTRHANIYRAD